jgi:hypothetical protein
MCLVYCHVPRHKLTGVREVTAMFAKANFKVKSIHSKLSMGERGAIMR